MYSLHWEAPAVAFLRRTVASSSKAMVTQSDPVEDWRRELRAMHKEVIDRLSLLGESLTANNQALAGEMRAMFSTVISRLTAIENRLPVPRRRTSTD